MIDAMPDDRRVAGHYGVTYGRFTVCGGCDAVAEGHVEAFHCGARSLWIIGDPFGWYSVVKRPRRHVARGRFVEE